MKRRPVRILGLCAFLCCFALQLGCAKDGASKAGQDKNKATIAATVIDSAVVATARAQPLPTSKVNYNRLCDSLCEFTVRLGCRKAEACKPNCLAMAAAPICNEELNAFFNCLATQPIAHWECLEDGTGSIREGFCEKEQAGFAACLQRNQKQ